jgi:hypothetical protein
MESLDSRYETTLDRMTSAEIKARIEAMFADVASERTPDTGERDADGQRTGG